MKKFYTDQDIEELFHNGVKSLAVTDDVVLTDLAFDKARKLGLLLDNASAPPAAPVRPYLSEKNTAPSKPAIDSVSMQLPHPKGEVAKHAVGDRGEGENSARRAALEKRIREKVAAKLGNQVDASLLDTIIKRTLKVIRLK